MTRLRVYLKPRGCKIWMRIIYVLRIRDIHVYLVSNSVFVYD